MNQQTESLKKTRILVLGLVHDLSNEQLNRIPDGFSNNIIRNPAHLVAAQQAICYAGRIVD